jgi:hypothetical protein
MDKNKLAQIAQCVMALEEKEGFLLWERLEAGEYTTPEEVTRLKLAMEAVRVDERHELLEKPKTAEEYRMLLLQFVGSLVLNDTVGDTMDDIKAVLDRIGYKVEEDDEHEDFGEAVQAALAKDDVTTLYGTSLESEEE